MEISITRALAEIKLIQKRIDSTIQNTQFVEKQTGKKGLAGYSDISDYENKVKSNYQSIKDLIARRKEIKSKIVESNSKTKVLVAGVEMTVAEAIERKTSIEYEEMLVNNMKADFADRKNAMERENASMERRLDELMQKNFGTEGKKDQEQYELISKPFIENNETKLIDPIGIVNEIEKIEKDIEMFTSEVDIVLSEANARTLIEIKG